MVNQNKEYYLGLYEKSMPNTLSWEEKLKVVKEAGFDYLEMSIDETEEKLARLDQSVDEIEKAIEKTYSLPGMMYIMKKAIFKQEIILR